MKRPPEPQRSPIVELARDEADRWQGKARPYAIAILFAFVHRLTTGETVEKLIDRCTHKAPTTDYEI